jgi:hypothetical protein
MFEALKAHGFEVETRSHAAAILAGDFPEVAAEIETILLASHIPIEEIIGSGGGETKGTQRLRRSLLARGWNKHNFVVKRVVDGVDLESQSHEIDHVRRFQNGVVALEIEWNNKDPFFDRDLENFKRLHADGAISIGVIVTRGSGLQDNMRTLVRRFVDERRIDDYDALRAFGLSPTTRQIQQVRQRVERAVNPVPFREAWVHQFVSDKFGSATTHWRKLDDRIRRGVGNPCPLVLIGLPASIVTFGEDPAVVEKLIDEGADVAEPPSAD